MRGHFSTELGRMRQSEMIERDRRYRLIQQAKLAAAREAAGVESGIPASRHQKFVAVVRRYLGRKSLSSPTRDPQRNPMRLATTGTGGAAKRRDLPRLRRLQADRALKRSLGEQVADQVSNPNEELEATPRRS